MEEIGEGIVVETSYDGVNVGAILTGHGIICIDTPSYPRDARDWVIRLERMYGEPITLIILTNGSGDRIINTRLFHAPILAQQLVASKLQRFDKRFPHSLIDSLIQRNPTYGREITSGPVQHPSLSFDHSISLWIGTEEITVTHRPGVEEGNAWIHIPERGVLFVGDSVVSGTQPILADMMWHQWLNSLTYLETFAESARIIVSGRGEIGDPSAVKTMQAYLINLKNIVEQHAEAGFPRSRLATRASELLDQYKGDKLPREWVLQQLTYGLERTYDELIGEDNKEPDLSRWFSQL